MLRSILSSFADCGRISMLLTFVHHSISLVKTLFTWSLCPIPGRQERSHTLHRSGLSFARTMRPLLPSIPGYLLRLSLLEVVCRRGRRGGICFGNHQYEQWRRLPCPLRLCDRITTRSWIRDWKVLSITKDMDFAFWVYVTVMWDIWGIGSRGGLRFERRALNEGEREKKRKDNNDAISQIFLFLTSGIWGWQ